MNTPTDNEFRELRRLLSLKRHEQPPPGYFENFSSTVIASLKADQRARAGVEGLEHVPHWILHLVERLQLRPLFASVVGAGLCVVVIGTILYYEKDTQRPVEMPSLISEITPAGQPAVAVQSSPAGIEPVSWDSPTPLIASNNLQSPPSPSLFDAMPELQMVPVVDRP